MNTKPYLLKLLVRCGHVRLARRVWRSYGLRVLSTGLTNLGGTGIFLPSLLLEHIGEHQALKQYEEAGNCFTIVSWPYTPKMQELYFIAKSGNSTKTGHFTYICLLTFQSRKDGSKMVHSIVDLVIKHTLEPYKTRGKLQVTWQNTRSKTPQFQEVGWLGLKDFAELKPREGGLSSQAKWLRRNGLG